MHHKKWLQLTQILKKKIISYRILSILNFQSLLIGKMDNWGIYLVYESED